MGVPLKKTVSKVAAATAPSQRIHEYSREEMARLNNELIALQLQLARKNDQLQQARESLERQGLRCRPRRPSIDNPSHDGPPGGRGTVESEWDRTGKPPLAPHSQQAGTREAERALELIRRIVQLRGGHFWKEFGGPDKDIRFCFTLGNPSPKPSP